MKFRPQNLNKRSTATETADATKGALIADINSGIDILTGIKKLNVYCANTTTINLFTSIAHAAPVNP